MLSALSRFLRTSEVVWVALALALAGCASDGIRMPKHLPVSTYRLPDLPPDLRACFSSVTKLPPGAWDSEVSTQVITDLRKSEAAKTECGRRLIAFYDDARREAAGGK